MILRETKDQLKAISAGDEKSMREFFEEHANTVYHYVMGRCGDTIIASDILNTVMMEVWKHGDRFEGRSKISTWLIGMARFKLIDFYRAEKRHQHQELEDDFIDQNTDGEHMVEITQYSKGLKSCINKLAGIQKEIVQLTFYSDMAYQEIAEIIECPVGTVKSRMYHAKESLKRCLEQFLGKEEINALI